MSSRSSSFLVALPRSCGSSPASRDWATAGEAGLAGITGAGRVASIGSKWQVPSKPDVLALLERQFEPS